MTRNRWHYALAIILVIVLGLLSRRVEFIPAWVGDMLWALMIYLIMRFMLIKAPVKNVAAIAITFCFAIEFSQLYQAPWINIMRQTLPWRLILGQGFLWTDLLAYLVGVGLGGWADGKKYNKNQ
ncbi:ribosomal maturation YjgA family protein [Mucilaginibacter terrae]|uniref:DUF2809 domain-containing protein n=1 Tax=Mucilaginibacter terrae TaxID=1955052 RepID=A0ABU3GUF3_9SPHI|nr:DUF2809 domain-containing protein [Mucilaginibacter terrae]MDT3403407.1 hypothetical protein [Mucilaginibacter terrae]